MSIYIGNSADGMVNIILNFCFNEIIIINTNYFKIVSDSVTLLG